MIELVRGQLTPHRSSRWVKSPGVLVLKKSHEWYCVQNEQIRVRALSNAPLFVVKLVSKQLIALESVAKVWTNCAHLM